LKNLRSAHNLAHSQDGQGGLATVMFNAQKHRQSEVFNLDQFGVNEDVCDYTVSVLVNTIRPSGEST
jgi:hypothetical protein